MTKEKPIVNERASGFEKPTKDERANCEEKPMASERASSCEKSGKEERANTDEKPNINERAIQKGGNTL